MGFLIFLGILVFVFMIVGAVKGETASEKVVDVSKKNIDSIKHEEEGVLNPFQDELDKIREERAECQKKLEENLEWQRKYNEYAAELEDVEKQMEILSRIIETSEPSRLCQVKRNTKEDAKRIGNDFEGYIADIMKDQGFCLIEWNQGYTSPGGAFAQDSLKPDFLVSISENGIDLVFWIECKYRSSLGKNGFIIPDFQIERYRKIQRETKRKVLIVLGLAGSPKDPDNLFIIPLDNIVRYKGVKPQFLSCFELRDRSTFRKHIADWFFNVVFKKPKNLNKFSTN